MYSSPRIVCDKVQILQALIPIPNTKATRRTLDVVESGARVDFGSQMTVQIDITISFSRASFVSRNVKGGIELCI